MPAGVRTLAKMFHRQPAHKAGTIFLIKNDEDHLTLAYKIAYACNSNNINHKSYRTSPT